VHAEVNSIQYKAILNIGDRPTVDGEKKTIEAHLIDFEGDLYGQELRIYFQEFLREEKKFESLDALKNQLVVDRERAIFIL
jgi:riboflavin kinase/FMN adenylyltransferase